MTVPDLGLPPRAATEPASSSRDQPLLGFSTLACPEWDPGAVIENASRMGFDAIEWRGGPDGHVGHLGPVQQRALRRRMEDQGLVSISVTAYTSFVDPNPDVRAANIEELVRHAQIAAGLGATDVRAFPGDRVDDAPVADLRARVAESIHLASDRLAGSGITIAIEPHDELVTSESIRPLLDEVGGPSVGVIWDIGNTWAAGELPETSIELLQPWLRYVQVKDGVCLGADWHLTQLGDGDVPLRSALSGLRGLAVPVISIEWERPWHPELEPAAIALPVALERLRAMLA